MDPSLERRPRADRTRRAVAKVVLGLTLFGVLARVAVSYEPNWSAARRHEAAAGREAHLAHDLREKAMSNPGEADDLRRRAVDHDALAAYHGALGRKYAAVALRPWAKVEPDPPPPSPGGVSPGASEGR